MLMSESPGWSDTCQYAHNSMIPSPGLIYIDWQSKCLSREVAQDNAHFTHQFSHLFAGVFIFGFV